jgi:hypothetical protein
LIDNKEQDLQTCSSNLIQTSFKAANLAAFLFAKSISVQPSKFMFVVNLKTASRSASKLIRSCLPPPAN